MTCPYCGEPHELSQCPRWRVPPETMLVLLHLCAPWLIPALTCWAMTVRVGAMLP